MSEEYVFNSQLFMLRRESFGGLLFCKQNFSVLKLAPFAIEVLEFCREPATEKDILNVLSKKHEVERKATFEILKTFLAKMRDERILICGDGHDGATG